LVPLAVLLGLIFAFYHYAHRSNMGGTSDESVATSRTTADFGSRLKTAIANGGTVTVSLEGASFDDSGNLVAGSTGPLSLLSGIMNDNRHLKATITAYGNTSEEAATRANALKSALVKNGISEDRIDARSEIGNTFPKISFTK